jgi:hypothetical protein
MIKLITPLLASLLLSTTSINAGFIDGVAHIVGGSSFSDIEQDYIDDNDMSSTKMYLMASDAFESKDWFVQWLIANRNDVYTKYVRNDVNFPSSKLPWHNAGIADAFRHIMWTALMAQKYGQVNSEEFSDIHEVKVFGLNHVSGMNTMPLNKESEHVDEKKWNYYKVTTTSMHSELKVMISNLDADVDLYVRQGENPTLQNYKRENTCRPYAGSTTKETCNMDVVSSTYYYIGVYGYKSGSYDIKAYLIDDLSIDIGVQGGLTPMDYHNNYIGASLGSTFDTLSKEQLQEKVKDFLLGNISTYISSTYNSHTMLPQNKAVIYDSFTNGSTKLKSLIVPKISTSANDADIEYFYNKYKSYFGSKEGNNYSCYTSYTCQNFTTGKKIAVHNGNKSLHYHYGSGWKTWRNNY